MPIDAQM